MKAKRINLLKNLYKSYSKLIPKKIECNIKNIAELTPKNKKVIDKTGYLRSLQWIRKDIFIPVKGRILVKKGKKIKLFSAKDITKIDGIWTAKTLQMITTKNKKLVHKSVFQLKSIKYNTDVGDEIFSTEVMQRGL